MGGLCRILLVLACVCASQAAKCPVKTRKPGTAGDCVAVLVDMSTSISMDELHLHLRSLKTFFTELETPGDFQFVVSAFGGKVKTIYPDGNGAQGILRVLGSLIKNKRDISRQVGGFSDLKAALLDMEKTHASICSSFIPIVSGDGVFQRPGKSVKDSMKQTKQTIKMLRKRGTIEHIWGLLETKEIQKRFRKLTIEPIRVSEEELNRYDNNGRIPKGMRAALDTTTDKLCDTTVGPTSSPTTLAPTSSPTTLAPTSSPTTSCTTSFDQCANAPTGSYTIDLSAAVQSGRSDTAGWIKAKPSAYYSCDPVEIYFGRVGGPSFVMGDAAVTGVSNGVLTLTLQSIAMQWLVSFIGTGLSSSNNINIQFYNIDGGSNSDGKEKLGFQSSHTILNYDSSVLEEYSSGYFQPKASNTRVPLITDSSSISAQQIAASVLVQIPFAPATSFWLYTNSLGSGYADIQIAASQCTFYPTPTVTITGR